eukprot:CAMPEP_0197288852 /NCGR_PEP_ID=MMETSP0890-20130614/6034_1 /TAXON_ID=44058 ORGANISM="Aureoumbra lagunensis, Strain CCMP1510" /NCGR_SAMPLE_ID=MMETSP0890 /ASSEMBLY_ACC=CAM_ASM_000533 /LENGTH=908 /DNA_ID=CAMNT_0042759869 /DNA_START=150 /DNA_END=2876 /DNA_ORIENTATION=-
MTVGKDVSMLFTDVVNCIQTSNIELKKLVYLYLINYAKSQPELILLSVNTFVKDAADPNPLVRALAIRTMGCIRVERIIEYLCEPLQKTLRDEDPYVRKTAAMCVAKLYDIQPELVIDRGFVDALRDLVSDPNPTVVANAVAALNEIAETSSDDSVLELSTSALQKLLAALNECTEWGQVSILDALAKYQPTDAKDALSVIERVMPRLQHANSAVVLSAVKVILRYMKTCYFHTENVNSIEDDTETLNSIRKKLAPPLVTLLNSDLEEITYVALRNINLIVQAEPKILENEVKVFFCKYNDPIYVKLEKLEIMIRLVSERNIDQVLLELKEYAQEVDVDFVRRAVRAIGRCAIKLEKAAQRCINVLLELIQTKINYVVQESVIVTTDIFRRYPQKYEAIIATLCENLESLDEPQAKASMIWIIGEYADEIENADELLENFIDSFEDETAPVQLQLVTAAVKLFLKQPDKTSAHEMVQKVLGLATDDASFGNPDLRDRGFVYWRLLSADPDAAKAVVLADKPTITDDTHKLDKDLLDQLLARIATLASVFHKPPEAFVTRETQLAGMDGNGEDEYTEFDEDTPKTTVSSTNNNNTSQPVAPPPPQSGEVDLLDMSDLGFSTPAQQPQSEPTQQTLAQGLLGDNDDLLFGGTSTSNPTLPKRQKIVVCQPSAQSGGIGISAAFELENGQPQLELVVLNQSQRPLNNLAIQFNKSALGLAPAKAQIPFIPPVPPNGGSSPAVVPIVANSNMLAPTSALDPSTTTLTLQVAMKNSDTGSIFYFAVPVPFEVLFSPDGAVERSTFIEMWKSIDDSLETYSTVSDLPTGPSIDAASAKLQARRAFHVARRTVPNAQGTEVVFFSIKTLGPQPHHFLVELTFKAGLPACKVCVKTTSQPFANLAKTAIETILRAP